MSALLKHPHIKGESSGERRRRLDRLRYKSSLAYTRRLARKRNWYKAHRQQQLDYRLRYKYGISQLEWDALFEKQGYKCAACGSSDSPSKMGWHTDHDHKTKKVRGILCHACNSGLGLVKEDIARLLALAEYLTLHKN